VGLSEVEFLGRTSGVRELTVAEVIHEPVYTEMGEKKAK